MFIILAYDVESRRVGKVMKIVKRYLNPVQRSLFQGFLTEKQCRRLKEELIGVIHPEKDEIILYKLPDTRIMRVDELGTSERRDTSIL